MVAGGLANIVCRVGALHDSRGGGMGGTSRRLASAFG